MRNNPEKLNNSANIESQREIKEQEAFLHLIFIDDDTFTTDAFKIIFNKNIRIKNKNVFCKTFNVYNQETEEYIKGIKEDQNQFIIVDLWLGNQREGGLGVIKRLRGIGYKGKIFLLTGIAANKIHPDIKIDRILERSIGTEELCKIIASYLQ